MCIRDRPLPALPEPSGRGRGSGSLVGHVQDHPVSGPGLDPCVLSPGPVEPLPALGRLAPLGVPSRSCSPPRAFGPGLHALLFLASSAVCLACGRLLAAGEAHCWQELVCVVVPFLPAPALLVARSVEARARLRGLGRSHPIRPWADRRELLPHEPD